MSTYINNETGHHFNIHLLPAPDFLKEYLNYLLAIENLSVRTVDNYYILIKGFLAWAHLRFYGEDLSKTSLETCDIRDMSFTEVSVLLTQDIHEYLSFAKDVLDNGDASRSYRLTAVKSFYNYYVKTNPLLDKDPSSDIPFPKRAKLLPKYLTEAECIKLLKVCAQNPENSRFSDKRDYLMICLMVNCGMRLSELIGINISDISPADNSLRLFGKGRKERVIYLNAACLEALNDYIPARALVRNIQKTEALLVSDRTGSRITQRRVQQILDDKLAAAGLSDRNFSPHKLRHTAATLMYQNGEDVLVLKEILGHESISTTQIYTHLGNTQVRTAMEHSPLANINKDDLNK